MFVSTNTTMGFRVIGAVLRGVLDRYLPDPMENVEPLPLTDLDKIAGHWSTYRHPVTTPDKIIRALQTVVVQQVSDNELMVAGLAEHPTYWRQVAPLEFKESGWKCQPGVSAGCFTTRDAGRQCAVFVLQDQLD